MPFCLCFVDVEKESSPENVRKSGRSKNKVDYTADPLAGMFEGPNAYARKLKKIRYTPANGYMSGGKNKAKCRSATKARGASGRPQKRRKSASSAIPSSSSSNSSSSSSTKSSSSGKTTTSNSTETSGNNRDKRQRVATSRYAPPIDIPRKVLKVSTESATAKKSEQEPITTESPLTMGKATPSLTRAKAKLNLKRSQNESSPYENPSKRRKFSRNSKKSKSSSKRRRKRKRFAADDSGSESGDESDAESIVYHDSMLGSEEEESQSSSSDDDTGSYQIAFFFPQSWLIVRANTVCLRAVPSQRFSEAFRACI